MKRDHDHDMDATASHEGSNKYLMRLTPVIKSYKQIQFKRTYDLMPYNLSRSDTVENCNIFPLS